MSAAGPARVAVVTDSAAALPADLVAAWGITVVPLLLVVGGTTYQDGDMPLTELLGRLDDGVSTSGPTPGTIAEAVQATLGDHDTALVLTIAHTMSSTYDAAVTAARLVGERVRVLDTATAAGAQGLVVLAAAQRAAEGADLDAVEAAARSAIEQVRLVATVGTLERLVKSGRVPGIAGWAGGKLGVNPMFQFRGGKVRPLRPAFSRTAALDRMLGTWESSRRPGARLHVAALHACAEDEAVKLLDAVTSATEAATSFIGEFSPVMVSHVGAGLVGLAWWWEDAARG